MNGFERIVQLVWALGGYLAFAALLMLIATAAGAFEAL